MEYKEISSNVIQEGVWDEKTCVRMQGGYDIDTSVIPTGLKFLPKGAILSYNAETGKVAPVKSIKVIEKANSSATSIKVDKKHIVVVGETLGGHKVTAINTSNEGYDVMTVASIGEAIEAGTVLCDANGEKSVGMNCATVKIDSNPSCTPTVQAYEIEEDTLPYPINDTIKAALTSRHAFKLK